MRRDSTLQFIVGFAVLACLLLLPVQTKANDYLEHHGHYSVMSLGQGVLRFTIPVWVYGSVNDYYLYCSNGANDQNDSYLWYSSSNSANRGGSNVHRFVSVRGERYGKNDSSSSEGEGYIRVHEGSVIIQSMYDGTRRTISADEGWVKLSLKRKEDDGHKRITYLQFDWYPPSGLDNQTFYTGISVADYKKSSGNRYDTYWWRWAERFTGSNMPQSPELIKPYLYASDANGLSQVGCAAIQYVTYQEPISYTTSLNSTPVSTKERSDVIVVPMLDTVQRFFSATFNVWTDKTAGASRTLRTNTVNIPAYHKIYNFQASEDIDARQSTTGVMHLSWDIHTPNAEDVVESDVFEVQRALKSDFSDAQSLRVVNYSKDSASYHISDNALQALAAAGDSTSVSGGPMTETKTVQVYDDEEELIGEYTASIKTERQYSPGRTVYYRVRRASSSFWGWDHEYVQSASVVAYTYLAPLAATQPEYSLDPDFENNRKVHFRIRIENAEVPQTTIPLEDCTFSCDLSKAYVDSIPIAVTIQGPINNNYRASLEVRLPEGSVVDTIPMTMQGNQMIGYVNGGSDVTIHFTAPIEQSVAIPAVSMPIRAQIQVIHQQYMSTQWSCSPITYQVLTSGPEVERLKRKVSVNTDSVKNVVYQQMLTKAGTLAGTRCAWDKNARLYLRKVHVENADTIRLPIPYDSIARQPDGSWIVHYTDVANLSCTHYSYAAYIDQSASPRKVWNSTQLQPKPITGPELYRNTVATVNNLTATQGTDKTCVLLRWVPGGGSVDEYRIWRKDAEMSSYEKIGTTDKANYRDMDAVPDKHYSYMVEAVFTCNGTTTIQSATTTGWRSPYGSISGFIRYADGLACYNVTVTVTGGGQSKTVTTNQAGAFFVDSLLYGTSTTYTIVPTSQSAQFVYGNTTTPSTTVTLTTDHPVAEGVAFTNISSVRVTGRVLYENSTIPVRDATFLLSGHLLQNANGPVRTDVAGNFTISVPSSEGFTLQVQKDGHQFEGDGYVRINGSTQLSLKQPLDGVRLWDKTKVRLMGRVAGGTIQASKPIGFGLSTNNLGDNIRLVLELEGDNTSSIVNIPDSLYKDTLQFDVDGTHILYQKKRITISVNPATGEYKADLYPVRYKVVQATAQGYATLFAAGKSNETIDLSNAATVDASVTYEGATAQANAIYSITYRSPIDITCTQMRYGMAQEFYGEETMSRQNLQNQQVDVPLAEKDSTGTYQYLFGAPVFMTGNYEFSISAHEDYYYNNDPNSAQHEQVPVKGGTLTIYNGLHDAIKTQVITTALDADGEAMVTIPVDYVSFVKTDEAALRMLDLSVESEGAYIEKQAFQAYVTGNRSRGRDFMTSTHGTVQLLDILRDPPGSTSSAYVETGTTYKYNYTFDMSVVFGLNLSLGYGASANMAMGTYAGVGGGVFVGNIFNVSTINKFDLPIKASYYYKRQGSYTFETSDRIETSADPYYVGQDADVYIGLTQNVYYDITDAVKPIDSVTFELLEPQVIDGTMRLITTGRDRDGKLYYLVTGREIAVGPYLNSTFHYTHRYIRDVMLPNLVSQRDALLINGDSATVQAIADAQRKAVYWSKVLHTDSTYALSGGYRQLIPSSMTDRIWPDEVDAYNRQILNWTNLLLQNETEKVNALYSVQSEQVGNYSVSYGTRSSHNETYAFSNTYTSKVDYPGASVNFGQGAIDAFGKMLGETVKVLLLNKGSGVYDDDGNVNKPHNIVNQTPGAKFEFDITPLFDINFGRDPNRTEGQTKKTGFTLQTGDYGYMDVSVFRVVNEKDTFNSAQAETGEFVSSSDNGYSAGDKLYGSYVYRLNGGASRCPWEPADSTHFYTPKIPLSAGTQNLENQKLDINVHERSFVPHDQPAIFNLTVSNEGTGNFNQLIPFTLKLKDDSNPKGAKIFIDGQPLSGQGRTIYLTQGTVYNKTMEVYAGPDYDYENLTLQLISQCNLYNISSVIFSVHYTPVSSPVNISSPHDKWILNTLSPYDERGYYLPVTIDGFDINYRGFDHIELQYKVSTQSDEAWVNLCSYYADSALYQAASGTKAMINSGKIEAVRFYGERDPIEQQYDLRAVSFSRVGTSFVTRSSAVMQGIKDTRLPRVFGEPEPVNAILGVGDNLLLRFNEAIAGNYLDEDNNFQIRGVTNATGITTGASVHFTGGEDSYVQSQVSRSLSGKSFTIDMMVKPTDPNDDGTFFYHNHDNHWFSFGISHTHQLYATINGKNFVSKTIDPMLDFTRVVFALDIATMKAHFYVGTKDVTHPDYLDVGSDFEYKISAPLCFGKEFNGDILEARIWSKALTQEEIAATHMHYLTGYERELMAYYRMNEGQGTTIKDYANGATLTMHGASWTVPKGFSLALDTTTRAVMAANLLTRSAVYDATYMLWFRATKQSGTIFSVGDKRLTLDNGSLVLHYGENGQVISHNIISDTWYHLVWVINRTYNTYSIYLDNELMVIGSAEELSGMTGDMYLGGDGFKGYIDEFVVFEQALPKTLIEEYGNRSPVGDEMGLMAYLPFQQQRRNINGILELVFSVNDQRRYRDPNGNVISVVNPLITGLEVNGQLIEPCPEDRVSSGDTYAPVRGLEQLSNLNFDWSFNNDELMINLNMPDREINKQTVYITVRDVEDLNGNPMQSPVMWLAYVDRNSIKWAETELIIHAIYGDKNDKFNTREMKILNYSGKRHQYTIESLPDWLKVDRPYGSLQPTEDKTLTFTYDVELAVGVHSDLIYLTDENGLSEPLRVQLIVEAQCPWNEVNSSLYTNTMDIRGQIKLNNKVVNGQTVEVFDSDPNDVIAVFCGGELVGKAYNTFDNVTNRSFVYLTIHGNSSMSGKLLTFKLWQASTGKVFNLRPSAQQRYQNNAIRGYAPDAPVQFSTYAGETQQLSLNPGWNWLSFYLKPQPDSLVNTVFADGQGWTKGDLLKTPSERQVAEFDGTTWKGTLQAINYHQMYMAKASAPITISIDGAVLSHPERTVTLYNGWSSIAYLLDEPLPIQDALADYYNRAAVGDVIKSKSAVAVFSENRRWEGSLQTLRPGEGYLFRRLAKDTVVMTYYPKANGNGAPALRDSGVPGDPGIASSSATNMTMVVAVKDLKGYSEPLLAYVGNDLAGTAYPQVVDGDTLYFFTISSDKTSDVRFTTADTNCPLSTVSPLRYTSNDHHGTVEEPVVLIPFDEQQPQKIMEDGQFYILMPDGTRYSATGKQM